MCISVCVCVCVYTCVLIQPVCMPFKLLYSDCVPHIVQYKFVCNMCTIYKMY